MTDELQIILKKWSGSMSKKCFTEDDNLNTNQDIRFLDFNP